MNDVTKRYLWLVALMATVGFVADQTSKYVVFTQLATGDNRHEIVAGNFELRVGYTKEVYADNVPVLSFLRTISSERIPHVNKGALFGLGNDGEGLNWLFALVSIGAAVFIVYWVRRPTVACDRFLCLSLGMILGGTLGNLYDRLVFDGVRDFLHFYYLPEVGPVKSWPDFNIADCCLVCGACVLLVHSFLVKEKTDEPAKSEVAAPLQTTTTATGA